MSDTGFRRPTYKLRFDGAYEGLRASTRGTSIDEVAELSALCMLGAELIEEGGQAQRQRLFELLAGKLLDWNLEDDNGSAVPLTAQQLAKEDHGLVLALATGLLQTVSGVSRPLDSGSTPGSIGIPVPEIPMEAL